jgi:hypothetical protein
MKRFLLVLGGITTVVSLVTALINYDSSIKKASTTTLPPCVDLSHNLNFGKQIVVIPGHIICADRIQINSEKLN